MVSVFLGHDFHRSLGRLDSRLVCETNEAIQRLCRDRSSPGLNVEPLFGRDGGVYSARVTLAYRLIFAETTDRIVALWVGNHDEAYQWADRHRGEIPGRIARTNLCRFAGGPAPVPRVSPDDPIPVPDPDLLDEMAARGFEHYFAALDDDQRSLVEYNTRGRRGLMFVTAGAGTGKTSIAIRRALHLAEQPELSGERVLYLCFNRVLMRAVRNTIDTLAAPGMAQQIEVDTFHNWAGEYLWQRGKYVSVDWGGNWLRKAVIEEAPRLPEGAQKELAGLSIGKRANEIEQVLRPNQFYDVDPYLNLTRPAGQGLSPLRRPQRQAIWDLHQRILQRDDFKFGGYDRIERARAVLAADADPPRYRAVIVDEGQDCSPVMARLAKALVAGEERRLMVLADPAQALYPGTFLWSRREFGPRGGQARLLLRPYRSTRQIYALAASLYANVDEMRRDIGEMPEAQREGPLPRLAKLDTYPDGHTFIIGEIRKEIKEGHVAGQIVVLTGTREQRDAVRDALKEAGVPACIVDRDDIPDGSSVSLATVHAAKGLDFASVYLLNPELRRGSIDNRRAHLYVALTRSSRNLCIVRLPYEPSPSLLDDLDPACYERVDPPAV